MKYAYKCSRCRTRHYFTMAPWEYVRKRKCLACGYLRFYREKKRNQETCWCSGYHFPHRKGGRHCHSNPHYEYNERVYRWKEDGFEVFLELSLAGSFAINCTEDCPF